MVCRIMREPRNPSKATWSQAVFQSPARARRRCAPRPAVPRRRGCRRGRVPCPRSSRRPPRVGEGGAVTAAQQVGAGPGTHGEGALLEHRAEHGAEQGLPGLAVAARVRHAGGRGEAGQRRVVQAGGGREVGVGAAGAQGGGRVEGAGRQGAVRGGGLGGGDVHHDGAREVVAAHEVTDVGGEHLDPLVVGAGRDGVRVAGYGAAGPDLPVGGGQFGVHGGGQAVRQDTAVGEVLGALGQRAVDGVVPAEDEGRQRWQTARGEVGRLGDHAGRRVETGGDGGTARDGGRGHGPTGADEPDAVAGSGGGSGGGGGGSGGGRRFGGHGQPPCRTRTGWRYAGPGAGRVAGSREPAVRRFPSRAVCPARGRPGCRAVEPGRRTRPAAGPGERRGAPGPGPGGSPARGPDGAPWPGSRARCPAREPGAVGLRTRPGCPARDQALYLGHEPDVVLKP